MPKWRKLWVKTLESPDFDALPDDFTRLLWVLLPLALDKEGICPDNCAWLRSKLFPLRADVELKQIGDAIDVLDELGMVAKYEVAGRYYLWCPSFANHQGNTSKEADSLYPLPTDSRASPELVQSKSRTEADTEANADSNADVEATIDQPTTPVADSHSQDVLSFLTDLKIQSPKREELTSCSWMTLPYMREWWAYIQSWDCDDAVKVSSLIARLESRRQVPPEWRKEPA